MRRRRSRGDSRPGKKARHFAGYPSVVMFDKPPGQGKRKAVQHLLWGDWMRPTGKKSGKEMEIHSRQMTGWVRKSEVQSERLLELMFVDVGQGDGCLLVTPEDKHIVIDAGEEDNMFRFLRWRYGRFRQPFKFEAAVITHPDQDHYKGFSEFFPAEERPEVKNVRFGVIYHNGIVERKGKRSASLGTRTKFKGKSYLTGIVASKSSLQAFFREKRWKGKRYPTLLNQALKSGRVDDIRMVSAEDGFLPGYEDGEKVSIEVLGPVLTPLGTGKKGLPWFGSVGKTKNGHSVVLRLRYQGVTVMLGGDLNIPAEEHLLEHYTGLPAPKSAEDERLVIETARKRFEVAIAKSCHHGSADFSEVYLRAVNPIATVISSGDNEPHSHPRADALGATGRWGRGARPLIFSTELARSARETVKNPNVLRAEIKEKEKKIREAKTKEAQEKAKQEHDKLVGEIIDRSIAVFGTINVRTDGKRVVVAQKLEKPRSPGQKWDIYQLERVGAGPLQFISGH